MTRIGPRESRSVDRSGVRGSLGAGYVNPAALLGKLSEAVGYEDYFFESFQFDCAARPLPTGGWENGLSKKRPRGRFRHRGQPIRLQSRHESHRAEGDA